MRKFEEWINEFRDSIATFKYYIDFDKVYENVDNVKIELNILNTLVGSRDIENDFKKLLDNYPEVIKCIPILLAVRKTCIYARKEEEVFSKLYKFSKISNSKDEYVTFMRETGLFDLLQDRHIKNLQDYVTGIEVGLDSNARKNRGGTLMEKLVEKYIIEAGFVLDVDYFKQMNASKINEKFGIDLSILNSERAEKRFDYVIKTPDMLYAIETNFYSDTGSKQNEVAKSYRLIYEKTKNIEGFTFVWITDGAIGWRNSKRHLETAWDEKLNLWSINDLDTGMITTLKSK